MRLLPIPMCFFFRFPRTLNQREHLLAHGLEVTQIVPESGPYTRHAGEQAIVGRPTAQHPPEALNYVELGTITR